MTRRDMIIIAILVNTGLLAILFMMAINSDNDTIEEPIPVVVQQPIPETNPITIAAVSEPTFTPPPATPIDEGDMALKELNAAPAQLPVINDEIAPASDTDEATEAEMAKNETSKPEKIVEAKEKESDKKIVEITVKRGDSLDKIARANGTTIKDIKEANDLTSSRLDIGQVLKVPVGSKKKTATASTPSKSEPAKTASKTTKTSKQDSKQIASSDVEYYVIKSGDNPWKIARQFHIKLDDLLKLNNMDEEKARNLKAGDKIRVK